MKMNLSAILAGMLGGVVLYVFVFAVLLLGGEPLGVR